MKITRLELIHVQPRWLILKIHTDKDIVGLIPRLYLEDGSLTEW